MHKLFFVTGGSGTGKTTTVKALEKRRSDMIFRYFDTIGVPSSEKMKEEYGSVEEWQRQMTLEWVRRIRAHFLDEAPVILDGQMRQSYIVESCSVAGVTSYKIILFDCQDAERDRRLIRRGYPELANARMRRWVKYLRDQALIRGDPIIDTTGLSPQQAVETLETELASETY